MIRRMRAALLTAAAVVALAGPARADDLFLNTAVLQTLDKVTGRVQRLEVPVGDSVRWGSLEIFARACRKHPPEEQPPESAAFLDISELKPGEAAESLFRGWMFASSPGLSAMEHAVYDIWVLDCANRSSKGQSNTP